ncbi:hypothetical protein BDA99DRAFT_540325 [Phascolomyces articulosus]|uniref:Uncharacterized protein n=1 Tax=Phascolomyces articulosus TaxID=60185 RepID=A0AAD5PAU2_9FUNG|nr:hypothetical protein BDA99DRAFT_540325 [Phascolomyces articulosus]
MTLTQRQPQVIPAESTPMHGNGKMRRLERKQLKLQQEQKNETEESEENRRELTVTQRRSRRSTTTTTATIKQTYKRRSAHNAWSNEHVSSMLAWISKNKDDWLAGKSKSVRVIHNKIIRGDHSEPATYMKLHSMERDFWNCFEFVAFVHNGQVSAPTRRVVRERAETFKFYKECRAAFGPPEYKQVKDNIKVKMIPGPSPSPIQQATSSSQANHPKKTILSLPAPVSQQEQQEQQHEKARSRHSFLPSIIIPKPNFIIDTRKTKEQESLSFRGSVSPEVPTPMTGITSTQNHMNGPCIPLTPTNVIDHHQEPMMEDDEDGIHPQEQQNPGMIEHDSLLEQQEDIDMEYQNESEDDGQERMETIQRERKREIISHLQQKRLKLEEQRMRIQGIEIKMKRADLRFSRIKAKYEMKQAHRHQRILKYKKSLKILTSLTHSSSISSTTSSRRSSSSTSPSSSASSPSSFSS